MWDAPKSKAELYRRAVIVPWGAAAIGLVIAAGAIIFFLFIQSPPENKGRNTKTDLRAVYAGVAGVAGVAGLVWAFVTTNRWRVLSIRGRTTAVTHVKTSVGSVNGSKSLRVTFVVDGREYTVASSQPASHAEAIFANPASSLVLYDPHDPKRAEVLTPDVARLPDK